MRKPLRVAVAFLVPSRDYGQRAVYQIFGAWHVAVMLALILAITMIATGDRTPDRSAVAQAQVSIRIISGARVRLGRSSDDASALIHRASVRLNNRPEPAYLVEFR